MYAAMNPDEHDRRAAHGGTAAHGGAGWQPRTETTREEMGSVWGPFGNDSEWGTLRDVLLHEPGPELEGLDDPDAVQMLEAVRPDLVRRQHRDIAEAFRAAGVRVHSLLPQPGTVGVRGSGQLREVPPNTMFMADLLFMTPEGAVLARPASRVRAGEERLAAVRLAALGVPILRSIHGAATFEGADAMWLDGSTVLAAEALRTNGAGLRQLGGVLSEMGVRVIPVPLPAGGMHLMGALRLIAPGLAALWPARAPETLAGLLEKRGFRVLQIPDEAEGRRMALNFVTLAPNRVLMPAGCPRTQHLLESAGVECRTVEVGEIVKAAGGIACMSAVLRRDSANA